MIKKLCILVLFAIPFHLHAAVLDTLETIGSNNSFVTERVIDGVTVDMVTDGGNLRAGTYYQTGSWGTFGGFGGLNAPLDPANVSLSRYISIRGGFSNLDPITFTFDQAIYGFGLTTIDLLENAETVNNYLELKAYDSSNNLLATHRRNGPQGVSGLDLDWYVESGSVNITKVTLEGDILSGGFGIDDLLLAKTAPVPEPSTYACLFFGLLGMHFWVRRKKT